MELINAYNKSNMRIYNIIKEYLNKGYNVFIEIENPIDDEVLNKELNDRINEGIHCEKATDKYERAMYRITPNKKNVYYASQRFYYDRLAENKIVTHKTKIYSYKDNKFMELN